MKQFITVEEARGRILERLNTLDTERVFLDAAGGRVLAETLVSPADSPRFDNSARDGFALRYDDLDADGKTLRVIATIAAGTHPDVRVEPGTAARIMTGAPVPDGADTVVMQEYCEFDDDAGSVTIPDTALVDRGAWVRHAGENMAEGEAILEPGAPIGPADVGLLASFGRSLVTVSRRPRVAIVSTGDELVDLDDTAGAGKIVNSNAYMLAALVEQRGGEAMVLPIAADDEDAIRQTFGRALRAADLVISSGGVSVGDFDITGRIVDELTGGMDFWKIRMKPGKPLAFGTSELGGRRVGLIGLPGNPNSCFVCFHQFVRPAMAVLQGVAPEQTLLARVQARLAADVGSTPRRREYLSGKLDTRAPDGPVFYPADNQNSGNLRLFCQADALGTVEEGVAEMSAGDTIAVELL